MEKTTENQEHQPSQPELDLTQMEPITPKKVIKPEPSFLDRAKGLFAKKETAESARFHERKEPTFGQPAAFSTPASELKITPIQPQNTVDNATESAVEKQGEIEPTSPKTTVLPVVDSTPAEENKAEVEIAPQTIEVTSSTATPISAEKPNDNQSKLTQPENWAIMQKLPPKHRRLFIAIAGGVLVLLALLWLKPSSETVEEIQANQSNSMPIEFQSIDPNQQQQANTAVDNSQAAVTAENVETQPVVPTQNAAVNNGATNNNATTPTAPALQTTAPANNAKSAEQLQAEKIAEQQRREAEQTRLEKLRAEKAAQEKALAEKAAVEKAKADKLKEEQLAKAKAEKAKAEQQAKVTAEKAKTTSGAPVVEAKPAGSNVVSKVPVVEATKASSNSSSAAKAVTQPTTTAATSSKTLTVPKGVSLMQVFRDNKLNIGDVNAMSKASGAENVLSGFKPGDKVQVSLNSEGRVSTMRLSNGSIFTRQADGSYKFKK